MKYIERLFKLIVRNIDVKGIEALEIGGDSEKKLARKLVQAGASRVVTSNIDGRQKLSMRVGKVSSIYADAHDLQQYVDQDFDLIFGVAIMQHVREPVRMLASIKDTLRDGGHAFLHGDPIWSGPHGHHIYTTGPSGRTYRFNDETNCIPDWAHLYMGPGELTEQLQSTGISKADATAIVDFVHNNEQLNRIGLSRLDEAVWNSGMEIVMRLPDRGAEPDGHAALRLGHGKPGMPDYASRGVTYILKKTT